MSLKAKDESGKIALQSTFEAGQLRKAVAEIEKNIAEIEKGFELKTGELAKERNYEPWFYMALGIAVLFFLFKLTFSSFFLAAFLGGLVYLYKKFLHKDVRMLELKSRRRSPARRTSPPRRRCCWTSTILIAGGSGKARASSRWLLPALK